MMYRTLRIFILALLVVILCGQSKGMAEMRSITDQAGNSISIEKPFQRIISLYAAHTENLFSLGLNKEIIGVSQDEAFPPQTLAKPAYSYRDDIEKIIAAKPDLVLVRPMISQGYPDFIRSLQQLGITVVSLQPRTMDDVRSYWKNLGILTGRESQAETMIKKFETELQRIHTIAQSIPEAKRKRVYFEAIHSRMRTFSPDSIAIFALQSAGGINVARDAQVRHDTNIADYGKERILAKAKDIDVFLAQKGTMNRTTIQQLREEPGFPAIKAIQDKQIYIIDEKIVSRPTLRLLDGIYEIGRFLYPEQFNDVHDLMGVRTLSRAQFATMFCKLTNMPLKTPDYRQDIQKRTGSKHRYGEFADVDYATESYKFIETAVFRGLFSDSDQLTFSPEQPMTRAALAYSLFVYFDLPENDKVVTLKDVIDSSPNYEQTQTAVGLGLMNTMQDGLFNPQGTISGEEVFQIVNKAKSLSAAPQKQ